MLIKSIKRENGGDSDKAKDELNGGGAKPDQLNWRTSEHLPIHFQAPFPTSSIASLATPPTFHGQLSPLNLYSAQPFPGGIQIPAGSNTYHHLNPHQLYSNGMPVHYARQQHSPSMKLLLNNYPKYEYDEVVENGMSIGDINGYLLNGARVGTNVGMGMIGIPQAAPIPQADPFVPPSYSELKNGVILQSL